MRRRCFVLIAVAVAALASRGRYLAPAHHSTPTPRSKDPASPDGTPSEGRRGVPKTARLSGRRNSRKAAG